MARGDARHARSKADWDTQPSRSAQRREAAAEPEKRAPGRKNTRSWCRGKEGREHAPEIVFRPVYRHRCQWRPNWALDGAHWDCQHAEQCGACGKILREGPQLLAAECPYYPGPDGARAAAQIEAAGARERIRAARESRKRIITGPQGYRRRRQAS